MYLRGYDNTKYSETPGKFSIDFQIPNSLSYIYRAVLLTLTIIYVFSYFEGWKVHLDTVSTQKRRHFKKENVESPFPVPIASLNQSSVSNNKWCFFTAKLSHDNVFVTHSGDIAFLFKLVSFDMKGILIKF